MFTEFVKVLRENGVELSVQNMLEAVWLSGCLPDAKKMERNADQRTFSGFLKQLFDFGALFGKGKSTEGGFASVTQIGFTEKHYAKEPQEPPESRVTTQEGSGNILEVCIPKVAAVERSREFMSAFRSIGRRVPSNTYKTLDVEETIEKTIQFGRITPVLVPVMVRAWSVVIVKDSTRTSNLWRQAGTEIEEIVKSVGVFHCIKSVVLTVDSELFWCGNRVTDKSLISRYGRTLFLILSDCVAPMWHDGRMGSRLRDWRQEGSVLIIDWLPERLWQFTAIGRPRHFRFGATQVSGDVPLGRVPTEGGLRRRLVGFRLHGFPVVSIHSEGVEPWANWLLNRHGAEVALVSLPMVCSGASSALKQSSPSGRERLCRFDAVASPAAYRLARMLVSIPVSLPMIRLIRAQLLPDADAGVISEVLLGGLLVQIDAGDPEQARFRFRDDVVASLRDSISLRDTYGALQLVSQCLNVRVGGREFRSILEDPLFCTSESTGEFADEISRDFLVAAIPSLRRLGRNFAAAASHFERNATFAFSQSVRSSFVEHLGESGEVAPSPTRIDQVEMFGDFQQVEVDEGDGNISALSAGEFIRRIRSDDFSETCAFRIRNSGKQLESVRESLLYAIERRKALNETPLRVSEGVGGVICRLSYIEGNENEARRAARLMPAETSNRRECVIFITRNRKNYLYAHSNFISPGFSFCTKLLIPYDFHTFQIFLAVVISDQSRFQPTRRELGELVAIHNENVRYVIDRHALNPSKSPWLHVDPARNLQMVGEFEHVQGIRPARHPEAYDRYTEAHELLENGETSQGLKLLESAVCDFNDGMSANSLAWTLATSRDSAIRNGAKAIELALLALRLKPNDANFTDTLAAAYAASGRFREAVQAQLLACRKASADQSKGFESRLKMYESGQPFIE